MERAIKARGTWGCLMGLGSRNSPPGRRIAANGACFSICPQLACFPPNVLPALFQIGGSAVYLVAFIHASPDTDLLSLFHSFYTDAESQSLMLTPAHFSPFLILFSRWSFWCWFSLFKHPNALTSVRAHAATGT